ncbi:Lipase, putative [Candida maltosa Xu316]|uniref:Lipase, putative n=1 Tax=Candida maltosa (strain Xu316) TaxID=1245528 RepID=M3K6A8_CANMX|nr:Lipase, putative [Candida maltosa Xu316]
MVDYHLIILVHGVWGNASHLAYIEKQINENIHTNDGTKIHTHKTGSHSGYLTYDGIDVNGKRISDEVWEQTQLIKSRGDKVTKFSIIGYSLGGLISRYCIGYLSSKGYFDDIEPINFTTFCTPHVGVSVPQTHNLSVRLYNRLAPMFLADTGSQFFLRDKVGEFSKPLLVWMADPRSKFYKTLAKFKYKSLYANVVNDKRCSWFTASISPSDKVNSQYNKQPENIRCSYINGYGPNVIDYSKPLYYEKTPGSKQESKSKFGWFWKTLNWIKLIGTIAVYTPVFIITSIIQRILNRKRVSDFFRNKSNDLLHLYEHDEEEHPSMFTEISHKVDDEQETLVEDMYDAMDYKTSHSSEFPPIKLDNHQSFIVEKLNTIKWNKYPIIIRHTKGTHGAAVVKHYDPNFDEGEIVVKHYIKEVFKLD